MFRMHKRHLFVFWLSELFYNVQYFPSEEEFCTKIVSVHLLQTLNFLHALQIKVIWNKNTFLSQIAFRESCIDATVVI